MKFLKASKWIVVVSTILFALACGDQDNGLETVENKTETGQLIEKYTRRKSDFAKQGKYEKYGDNGKLYIEANYTNDTLDGERKIYREDGTLEAVENYINGSYEGKYQSFYPNGQVKFEGEYTNNAMEGVWKGYYESGQLKEEVMMENNNENGYFKEYDEQGKLTTEGNYLNGPFEKGELKVYDENGEVITRKICHRGICRDIWTKEGGDIEFDETEFIEFANKMKDLQQ